MQHRATVVTAIGLAVVVAAASCIGPLAIVWGSGSTGGASSVSTASSGSGAGTGGTAGTGGQATSSDGTGPGPTSSSSSLAAASSSSSSSSSSGGTLCAHDFCGTGVPLDPSCDPCVSAVCGVLPTCCEMDGGIWDVGCLNQIERTCGDAGNGPTTFNFCGKQGTCSHDLCTVGAPLIGGVPTACDLCVYVLCAHYPGCCSTAWSQPCVDQVQLTCALPCP